MPEATEETIPGEAADESIEPDPPRRRSRGTLAALLLLAILIVALATGWLRRESIADRFIGSELDRLGVSAQYEVESIGAGEQVLKNLVIGDPERPDLTIERVVINTRLRFGFPAIGRVRLEHVRLYGSYRDGKLTFGALDPLLFAEGTEPFRLPDLDLELVDGRALLESDFGPVGFSAEGAGNLRGGFAGELAASAPELFFGDCRAVRASLYGRIRVKAEHPGFTGPLRVAGLVCPESGVRLARSAAQMDLTLDSQLDGVEGRLGIDGGSLQLASASWRYSQAKLRFTYRGGSLVARYDLEAKEPATPQAVLATLGAEGRVRWAGEGSPVQVEGTWIGGGLRVGNGLDAGLASAAKASEGTLLQPVISRIRTALLREGRGSSLDGDFLLRRSATATSLVVPRATIRGGSGQTLLALSRLQFSAREPANLRLSGNFATGGEGLPRIVGRMERDPAGRMMMRIRMPEYRAGTARLALSRLMLVQSDNGALGFAGEALVSGSLPGGSTENLVVPLSGNWSGAGGLALWRSCTELRFDRLELANLSIGRRGVQICPQRGAAVVRLGIDGLKIAGGTPALDLTGRLGTTPIRIASGPVGFAWPGTLVARAFDISLGPEATASNFRIARLDARLGSTVSGTFEGADVFLDAVPLDILETAGSWRIEKGQLILAGGSFRLQDREQEDRFQPLVAENAELRLANNVITAGAVLREPRSLREVVRADLRHDLGSGRGSADLVVDGIVFDKEMQPDTVSRLALGIIANAEGVVRGSGRIDWNEESVTSTGSFTTDSLDFAAAFGPVQGLSGTVRFTDLLGLVTAPDQKLYIRAINPGIEVNDGVITFAMKPGKVLAVEGGFWPFLGGTLTLQPVTMALGSEETLRYTLVIEALDAGRLLEKMELSNLSATGTFDGSIPLVFDQDGGRIVDGTLHSRPPGGNVAYVGELTYKDLSAMANFAFDALRSIDYSQMQITMHGPLEGEIITSVTFDGIRQGEGAQSNFVTRRIAKLPIRFKVNIRAPFFQLVTSVRSLYDPGYIRDPRTLGLMGAEGEALRPSDRMVSSPKASPPAIQPSDSEDMQ